jgi:hypothetical protein
LSDGLDSGWVAVSFTALAAGGTNALAWNVAGASPAPITFSGASAMVLRSLKMRAAVDGAGRKMSFRNIVVKFFHNANDASPTQTVRVSSSSAPVADTTGLSDPIDAENILTVSAFRTDNQKVVVTAEIQLVTSDTVLPSQDGIFGDIYVFE